jgi:TonB family protein
MRRLVLALLLASVRQATAQTPCTPDSLSSLPGGDVAWCAAERAPSLVVQTPVRYPDVLRAAKVAGEVVLEVTIDTSGRIDFQTLKVRVETHRFFTNAVRQSMPAWRFVPASLDGKLVRARGVFHVEFLMPSHDSIPRDTVVSPARETRTGLDVALGWRPLAYDPPTMLDTTRLYGLIAAIARRHGTVDTTRVLCLEWLHSRGQREPPAALIDYLRDHGAPRLPPSRCPPTYASMFQRVDSLGRPVPLRPPGAVDPQILSISDLRPWAKDLFVFRYSVGVGMRREVGHCQGQWDASASEWRISCTGVQDVVS